MIDTLMLLYREFIIIIFFCFVCILFCYYLRCRRLFPVCSFAKVLHSLSHYCTINFGPGR
jgi:hypothetical protein